MDVKIVNERQFGKLDILTGLKDHPTDYCILLCILHALLCPNFLGQRKDAHYKWVVLIP